MNGNLLTEVVQTPGEDTRFDFFCEWPGVEGTSLNAWRITGVRSKRIKKIWD